MTLHFKLFSKIITQIFVYYEKCCIFDLSEGNEAGRKNKTMENRITRAIDIFLDALNNETLKSNQCSACAVGNLIAHAKNYHFEKIGGTLTWKESLPRWGFLFATSEGVKQLESTEFTIKELMRIEYTFESTEGGDIDKLAAVVELMNTFDEDVKVNTEREFTEKAMKYA